MIPLTTKDTKITKCGKVIIEFFELSAVES